MHTVLRIRINDEFAEPVVSLYPNPVFSSATLELDGNYSAAVLRIFNAIGEQVWWQPISARSTTISLEELQAGIYFYHLTSRARILASGKLVRE
ncbi:MAG: T9SS type A sorting domain-containing protein [Flavobacteriales bacterium]|nr:T9SS type A sorting domain-containing protein [Flavobacteriales bacterium]